MKKDKKSIPVFHGSAAWHFVVLLARARAKGVYLFPIVCFCLRLFPWSRTKKKEVNVYVFSHCGMLFRLPKKKEKKRKLILLSRFSLPAEKVRPVHSPQSSRIVSLSRISCALIPFGRPGLDTENVKKKFLGALPLTRQWQELLCIYTRRCTRYCCCIPSCIFQRKEEL